MRSHRSNPFSKSSEKTSGSSSALRAVTEKNDRMRKKLKESSHSVVMNALVLMETLMTECHTDFHLAMGNRKLANQMVKVIKMNKIETNAARQEELDMCLKLIKKCFQS